MNLSSFPNPQVISLYISSYQSATHHSSNSLFTSLLSSPGYSSHHPIPPSPFPSAPRPPLLNQSTSKLATSNPLSLQQFIFLTSYLLLKHSMSKLLIHLIFIIVCFLYLPVTMSPICKQLLHSVLPLPHFLLML